VRVGYVAVRAQGLDGWGRYTVETVRAVRERGIEPVLITADPEMDPALDGIERHVVIPRPLAGPFSGPLSLTAAGRLRRVLRTCDVVHGIVELYGPLISWSRPRRLPYVQTAHGSWAALPLRTPWRRWFYQAALNRVDLLVVQSEYTRDQIARGGRLPRHVVWPAGVRAGDFGGSDIAGLPSWAGAGPVILSVGAMRSRKGHHVALEAVARIQAQFPDLQFVIIGGGSKAGRTAVELPRLAEDLGLAGRAHFLGPVPFAELAAWYRRADVFLLLPVNRGGTFEGLGLVYFEASAAGKASVATIDSGAAEAVIHEETGLLVPQNDPAAAAEALIRLLGDDNLRLRMGDAARRRAQRFSWDHLAERLVGAYEALVDGKQIEFA